MSRRSTLSALFLFTDGLIRVGGRLALSLLLIDYAEKHPVARDCHLSMLLIREAHAFALHGGPQLTRSMLLRYYWIVQANRLIRSEIKRCSAQRRKEPWLNSRWITCRRSEFEQLDLSGLQE